MPADTAMILAIVSQTGAFQPMTTVQLQTSFLQPIPGKPAEKPAGSPAGDADDPPAEARVIARVIARVLRLGKRLVFGKIEVQDPAGRLASHANTTYALL